MIFLARRQSVNNFEREKTETIKIDTPSRCHNWWYTCKYRRELKIEYFRVLFFCCFKAMSKSISVTVLHQYHHWHRHQFTWWNFRELAKEKIDNKPYQWGCIAWHQSYLVYLLSFVRPPHFFPLALLLLLFLYWPILNRLCVCLFAVVIESLINWNLNNNDVFSINDQLHALWPQYCATAKRAKT